MTTKEILSKIEDLAVTISTEDSKSKEQVQEIADEIATLAEAAQKTLAEAVQKTLAEAAQKTLAEAAQKTLAEAAQKNL